MADKLRVGIIGATGRGDYGHGVDTVWAEIDRAEVVALADADEAGRAKAVERTKAPKSYADYREMLDKEQLDIVAIGPRWLDQHRDMCVAAAEHGCHIYMEKPFCRDLPEADEIVQACEMRHCKLAIAHQTRWSPPVDVVKREIKNGLIGRVLELRARGKEDANRGGGEDLWVLGSHVMNMMHALTGAPTWCFATVEQGGKPVTKEHVREGNEGIGPLAGDRLRAMYGMPDGATAYFSSHKNAAGRPSRFGLQIFGSKGIIDVVFGYLPDAFLLDDSSWSPGRTGAKWLPITSAGVDKPEPLSGDINTGNAVACRDLINAIEQDRLPECNILEGRMTVEMIAGVFESHRTAAPVAIPLKNRKNPLALL